MAEARREEEGEERRELRDVPSRSRTTDCAERTKSDHLHSSQGHLSSVRTAIKRTNSSQSGNSREQRRPEITIVSAEPLAGNSWFSGSVVCPPQSGWSAGIHTVNQVIQEKTQEEHIVKPIAAPRRTTCTTTSATQTDPVREDASTTTTVCRAAPESVKTRAAGKKPQKPPRPSLPKPVGRQTESAAPTNENVGTTTTISTSAEGQSYSKPNSDQPIQADLSHACTRSVTVYWDNPAKPFSSIAAEATPASAGSVHSQRPVPLPRTKSKKQALTEEVKVQALVKHSENCDGFHSDPEEDPSNKYLKELLEAFGADNEDDIVSTSDESLQGEDAGGEMSCGHSQRSIRARIKAFESQSSSAEDSEPARPEPQLRKPTNKPLVAAKPSVALKPQFNHRVDDDSQNVSSTIIPQLPRPAPKPLPPKKPAGLSIKDKLETLISKAELPDRSHPPALTRADNIYDEVPSPVPPIPPAKPVKEPLKPNLNINNHSSTSTFRDSQYRDSQLNQIPLKPAHNVDANGGHFARQSLTQRPTTIRVPSKTDSYHVQDNPPPLPTEKPVGHLKNSVNHRQSPVLTRQDAFQSGPELSLPPRRLSKSRSIPPRPPPAKTGPGRPPPPSFHTAGRASGDASNKQKLHRKGPVLPPRPNPGHRLYNKYTLQLPHAIADMNHNGSSTGELSFQKNEVLLLLEEIDHNTFECQVGDTRGRVHKSCMKVITPLSSASQGADSAASGGAGGGLEVQALHDFIPEGPGELGLRAGDVLTMVEQVDSEWYRGTCRGSTGFFPISYVKVLSNSPKPLRELKTRPPPAAVSGPRCVAKFDLEGEHSDELSFSEGDVIQLKAYVGQDWAKGQIGAFTGIFPLNFVEVVEDLPPSSQQQQQQTHSARIALPGMVSSQSTQPEVGKPAQASHSGVEWVVALYDFAGNSEGDLSFQQGDYILINRHIDAEWSCGQLNGREGSFPRAFVESQDQQSSDQKNIADGSCRARALYDFTSNCDEELSLRVGDIITSLESLDDEWFLGDSRGKRALVPKNYVQVLE